MSSRIKKPTPITIAVSATLKSGQVTRPQPDMEEVDHLSDTKAVVEVPDRSPEDET